MKFFLDTANLDHIREVHGWGILAGVTTNPSLVAKEGANFVQRVYDICELVKGPTSAEVVAQDREGMIREGRMLARVHEHVVVKVPLTEAGIAACRALSDEGIKVNVTLCFQAAQALIAARAGATYISPFIGRIDDVSWGGTELLQQIRAIYDASPEIETQILAASIRHPLHIVEAAIAGADVATCPHDVMKKAIRHPLTDIGNERFLKDWSTVPDRDICGQVESWLASHK